MQFKTISGRPPQYERDPPYQEHEDHIAAQLERAHAEGWRLVHTASFTPVSTERYQTPIFWCLLQKE